MSNENPEDEYPADFEKEDTLEPALPEGAAEAGGDDDFSGEEDFVEEDWETYDEEAYIDDGEGDGGLAERKAAFNRLIITGAVILFLGGGIYYLVGGKSENLGLPVMEEVSKTATVAANQKVEFHAETAVAPQEAFGVVYGKPVVNVNEEKTNEIKREGILNNPDALDKIRNREPLEDVQQNRQTRNAVEEVKTAPPMPAPISSAQPPEAGGGLIPMPAETRAPRSPEIPEIKDVSEETEFTRITAGQSYTEDEMADGQEMFPDPARAANPFADDDVGQEGQEPVRAQEAGRRAGGDGDEVLLARLDTIAARLKRIEDNLDALQDSVIGLETRVAKIEKLPVAAALPVQAPSPRHSAAPSSGASAKPVAAPAKKAPVEWVLKAAQPDSAMLARKGESEVYTITVGETFADLGQVTGIYMQDGRWIVQGTKGKIVQ